MHQVVGGKGWDHIDGNGLNNQELNLRPVTLSQQSANQGLRRNSSSGEPCVNWNKGSQKWLVRVREGGRCLFSAFFKDKFEAIQVARQNRSEIHGSEFVRVMN